jgi:signal transduction histidine kinase
VAALRAALWPLLDAYPAGAEAKLAVVRGLDQQHGAGPAAELVRLRGLLDALIHHAPASLAYVDHDLVFRWNNQTHCDTLGLPREAIIGRSAFQAAKPIVSRTEQTVRAALAGEFGQILGIPIMHQTRRAPSYWDLSYVPVPGEDGRPEGVLIVGAEVTDRVAAHRYQAERIERLEELDRLKDHFLAIISHELRTPLNAIMGFGSVLEDGVAGPISDGQARYVGKMLAATDTLLALIDDLLDMGRMRAGRFTIAPGPVALPALLDRAVDAMRLQAERGGHALTVTLPPGLPAPWADADRIVQVLTNLIANAIKFSPAGGPIEIAVAHARRRLRFTVADRGPGIAPADRERIFEPFVQLDGGATRARGGAGLGLAICRGLVEAHGGTIGVEPGVAGGSVFWFELPVG